MWSQHERIYEDSTLPVRNSGESIQWSHALNAPMLPFFKIQIFKCVHFLEKICKCSQAVCLPSPNFSEPNSKCTRRNKKDKLIHKYCHLYFCLFVTLFLLNFSFLFLYFYFKFGSRNLGYCILQTGIMVAFKYEITGYLPHFNHVWLLCPPKQKGSTLFGARIVLLAELCPPPKLCVYQCIDSPGSSREKLLFLLGIVWIYLAASLPTIIKSRWKAQLRQNLRVFSGQYIFMPQTWFHRFVLKTFSNYTNSISNVSYIHRLNVG
jgi:hypothetical protein